MTPVRPRAGRPAGVRSSASTLAVPVTAVEGLEIAHVRPVGGAERVVVDGPARGVLGVAMAMLLDQAMEELEEVPGGAEVGQGLLEVVVAHGVVDEATEARGV